MGWDVSKNKVADEEEKNQRRSKKGSSVNSGSGRRKE